MVGVLEGMAYIQQQGDAGRQRGTQNRLAQLASQAYGAPQAQQRGLVQQAIQADPQAGFALSKGLGDDRQQRIAGLSQQARMLVSYAKAGNRQGVDSLYPQIAAEAQAIGLGQGIPTTWDESFLPGMEQLANIGGGSATTGVQSTYVDAQGNRVAILRDGSTQVLGQNAPNNQIIDTGNGFYGVNKGNLQAAPVMVGGAPQQAPQTMQAGNAAHPNQEAVIAQANQMAQQGVPSEQIDSWIQTQLSQPVATQGGGGPGQQLRSVPKPAASQQEPDIERRLRLAQEMGATPEELRRMVVGGSSARDAQRISTADATKARQKMTQIASARQQLEAVKENFRKLKNTFSAGPGGQYLPTPEGQAFDRAIANLAPLVTAVTRVPGIGAMSDYESRLQNASLPSRGTYENVTEQQIADLERLFDTIESGYTDLLSGAQMQKPAPADAPQSNAVPSGNVLRYNPATGDFE